MKTNKFLKSGNKKSRLYVQLYPKKKGKQDRCWLAMFKRSDRIGKLEY